MVEGTGIKQSITIVRFTTRYLDVGRVFIKMVIEDDKVKFSMHIKEAQRRFTEEEKKELASIFANDGEIFFKLMYEGELSKIAEGFYV